MNHVGDLLSAYLDGELTPSERALVVDHLDGCSECRFEMAGVDAARSAIRSLPILDSPVSLEAFAHRRRRRLASRLGAMAAAAAVVAGFAIAGSGSDEPAPLDLDAVVRQHSARASVDPGLIPINVISVVNEP